MAARVLLGRVVVTTLLFFTETWTPDVPAPTEHAARIVFWPATVLVLLTGPGPRLGRPEQNLHEATPMQLLAVIIGIGFSWFFYSSLVFLWIWLGRRRHNIHA